MNVAISVTAGDIARGLAGDCARCPVARAIARGVPPWVIAVGPDVVSLAGVELSLPRSVRDFIGRFDGGFRVEPFSFVLDVPDELIRAGAS